ncbi:hypothetical protein GCM10022223_23910 [Kineosporia mesophila]|uniref:Uncharacterized protein n=1 Tax=Kineosporia mesophila TaxID=566012 RepID=A0ABP6ZF06_9ACTN
MATIGLPKSLSVMPVARQSARAPAMLRPLVEVADRSCVIVESLLSCVYGRAVPGQGRSSDQMSMDAR